MITKDLIKIPYSIRLYYSMFRVQAYVSLYSGILLINIHTFVHVEMYGNVSKNRYRLLNFRMTDKIITNFPSVMYFNTIN